MRRRSFRQQNSGQILVITSLLVTLLLFSTSLYVIDLENDSPRFSEGSSGFFGYVQNLKNALVSSLVNITNGGEAVLSSNLDRVENALTAHSYNAILQVEATPLNETQYVDGIWIFNGTDGHGIASAYANLIFNSSGTSMNSNFEYDLNVSSAISLSGTYVPIQGKDIKANVTLNVFNENNPALARNFTVYIQKQDLLMNEVWVEIDSPTINDFRNGTYLISFASDKVKDNPVLALIECHDERGILIRAIVPLTDVS